MGSNSSILDIIARGGPSYTVPQNEATQNQSALTAAQIPETQARTAMTQAQVPLVNAQVQAAVTANQIQQQQLRDAALLRQLYTQPNAPSTGLTPNTGTASPVPAPVGPAATPYQIPNSAGQPGLINRTGSPVDGVPSVPAAGANVAPAGSGAPQASPIVAPGVANPAIAPSSAPTPSQPNLLTDPAAVMSRALHIGISYPVAFGAAENAVKLRTALASLNKDETDTELKNLGMIQGALVGYAAHQSDGGYQKLHDFIADKEPKLAETMPVPGAGVAPAMAELGHVAGVSKYLEQALADQKTQAETRAATAGAAKSEAETVHQEALNKILTGVPSDALGKAMDGIAPPGTNLNARGRALLSAARTPEEQQQALAYVFKEAGETDPDKIKARINEAVETRKREAPIEQAMAGYQNALHQGDEGAAKYYEARTDYEKANATAGTIKHVVDLANAGNSIAGQQLKAIVPEFTNAMQDIKRMGGAQGNEGMSNLFQHGMGIIKSISDNVPIRQADLDAIGPYVDTIKRGAASQLNATVDALHSTPGYGGNRFEKSAGVKVGEKVNLGGSSKTVTAVHPDGTFDAN